MSREESDAEDPAEQSDGLEYDENASLDESGSDGSEYQESGEDSDVVADSQDEQEIVFDQVERPMSPLTEGEDEEAVMLDAAIQDSLRIARNGDTAGRSSAGAGPSKPRENSRAARAQRIAAAVEKRLKGAKSLEPLDSDDLDEGDSSDEQALSNSKQKKPAAKKGATSAKARTTGGRMTMAELKKARKEKRLQAQVNKKEELALRKKLGRRLTPVCISSSQFNSLSLISESFLGREVDHCFA